MSEKLDCATVELDENKNTNAYLQRITARLASKLIQKKVGIVWLQDFEEYDFELGKTVTSSTELRTTMAMRYQEPQGQEAGYRHITENVYMTETGESATELLLVDGLGIGYIIGYIDSRKRGEIPGRVQAKFRGDSIIIPGLVAPSTNDYLGVHMTVESMESYFKNLSNGSQER